MVFQGLETSYRMLKSRGLAPSIPGGDILIFSVAMSGFLHFHRYGRGEAMAQPSDFEPSTLAVELCRYLSPLLTLSTHVCPLLRLLPQHPRIFW